MAKSLSERIASARASDRTTIETLEALLGDCRAESERLTFAHEAASADSIDFALSDDDREEAASKASKYARTLAALDPVIGELEAKIEAKRNSDAQREKKAAQAASIAERDELARRFADRVPAIIAELTDLFGAVKANDARLRAAGLNEQSAEAVARGVSMRGLGGDPESYLTMKIPNFDGAGRAWPLPANVAARLDDYAASKRRAEESERLAKERDDAAHGLYRLINRTGLPIFFASRRNPMSATEDADLAGNAWEGELRHDMAERLGAMPNITVEPINPPSIAE